MSLWCAVQSLRLPTNAPDYLDKKKKKSAEKKAKPAKAIPAKPVRARPNVASESNPYKKAVPAGDVDDIFNSIMGGLDAKLSTTNHLTPKSLPTANLSRKRKLAPHEEFAASLRGATASSFMTARTSALASSSSTLPTSEETGPSSEGGIEGVDLITNSKKPQLTSALDVMDVTDDVNGMELDVNDAQVKDEDDDELSIKPLQSRDQNSTAASKRRTLVNAASIKVVKPEPNQADIKPKIIEPLNAPKAKGTDWQAAAAAINVETITEDVVMEDIESPAAAGRGRPKKGAAVPAIVSPKFSALEDDGSLKFYWLDVVEVDGVLRFIGKILNKDSGKFVSACLTVEGIERNLYVLPRGQKAKRVKDDSDDGEWVVLVSAASDLEPIRGTESESESEDEDDDRPSQDDIYEEFDSLRERHGITHFAGKFVQRKYAFELKDIPAETEYLKVVYSFSGTLSHHDLTANLILMVRTPITHGVERSDV